MCIQQILIFRIDALPKENSYPPPILFKYAIILINSLIGDKNVRTEIQSRKCYR